MSLALVIQHATRMRYIVLPYVAFLDLQHVSSLSHKRYDSRKKVNEHEIRVLIFSTMFFRNISHSAKNSARYYYKFTEFFSSSTRHCFQILMILELSRQIFEKYSNIKFNEKFSGDSWVVPCARTDKQTDGRTTRHKYDKTNSHCSWFCERA